MAGWLVAAWDRLVGMATLDGVVRCPTGPLAGAGVVLQGPQAKTATTKGDGTYRVRTRAGAYTARCMKAGYVTEQAAIYLQAGAPQSQDWWLEPVPVSNVVPLSGTIVGRAAVGSGLQGVVALRGEVAGRAGLEATLGVPEPTRLVLDPPNATHPSATYDITATAPGYLPGTVRVVLKHGEVRAVSIPLDKA